MNIAVLGAGGMGRTVIGHLRKSQYPGKIIPYDVKQESLDKVKQQYELEGTTDLETILKDKSVGLVFITAANFAHASLAVAALEAGKAVMCEKPMANTIEDAKRMVDTAKRLKGYLQIGFELRYSKLYTMVKDWIDKELLGRVVHTQCTYICEEFHGKLGWRHKKSSGGGMFGEKLSHYVDLPRWWINSPVTQVYSVCSPNVVPYFEVRDNYQTTCKYENGAVSHLTFMMALAETFAGDPLQQDMLHEQVETGHELKYLVLGTKGAVETDVFRRRIRRYEFTDSPTRLISKIVDSHSWPAGEDHVYFHNTQDQTTDIVRRVEQGLPPQLAPEDALDTMRVVFAAEVSADSGKPVDPRQL